MSIYGCDELVDRACNNCPIKEPNKIVAFAFLESGTEIDTSDPQALIDEILAAEGLGGAQIIRQASGAYDGGSIVYGPGPGKTVERIIGVNHVITLSDFDYIPNAAFWKGMSRAGQYFNLIYFTSNYAWVVGNAKLTIAPKPGVTNDINSLVEAVIEIRWSKDEWPLPYEANVDDLLECPDGGTSGSGGS